MGEGAGGQKALRPRAPPPPPGLTDPEYQLRRLVKRGVNLMADEKLEEAAAAFERALAVDPRSVEAMLKLGYARFHMGDHPEAMEAYDRALEVDVANAEAWNLKSLVYNDRGNLSKALDCAEKAVECDPGSGMAWYNRACYLSRLGQVPASLEALKRSIEIDVTNARRAVKDKDFAAVRAEDGFRRIVHVVVLESVRQGYHTVGAIVWTTFLGRADVESALRSMQERGILVRNERREGLHRVPVWDMAPEIAGRAGAQRRGLLGIPRRISAPVLGLRGVIESVRGARAAVEARDAPAALRWLEGLIDPKRHGPFMIERFLEEHREARLWKVRIEDRGAEYLEDSGEKMSAVLDNVEAAATKMLREASRAGAHSAERSQ